MLQASHSPHLHAVARQVYSEYGIPGFWNGTAASLVSGCSSAPPSRCPACPLHPTEPHCAALWREGEAWHGVRHPLLYLPQNIRHVILCRCTDRSHRRVPPPLSPPAGYGDQPHHPVHVLRVAAGGAFEDQVQSSVQTAVGWERARRGCRPAGRHHPVRFSEGLWAPCNLTTFPFAVVPSRRSKNGGMPQRPSAAEVFLISALAKTSATLLTYPMMNIKVPCRAVPCRAVPCRAVPCRAVPCRAVLCCPLLSAVAKTTCTTLLTKDVKQGRKRCSACHTPGPPFSGGSIASPLCALPVPTLQTRMYTASKAQGSGAGGAHASILAAATEILRTEGVRVGGGREHERQCMLAARARRAAAAAAAVGA